MEKWIMYVDYGYGWEYELEEYTFAEIIKRIQEYLENCPQYEIKITYVTPKA